MRIKKGYVVGEAVIGGVGGDGGMVGEGEGGTPVQVPVG